MGLGEAALQRESADDAAGRLAARRAGAALWAREAVRKGANLASAAGTMIPASLAVILAGLVMGFVALVAFVWAWRKGHFDHLDAQARVIFDARDYRLERPWESAAQREERRRMYGEPIVPEPGEWGGAG